MDIWAAAGADITTDGAEAAVIITDGTEDAVTTNIAGKPSLNSLIVIPLPGRQANCSGANGSRPRGAAGSASRRRTALSGAPSPPRSEEHTSELQSHSDLV